MDRHHSHRRPSGAVSVPPPTQHQSSAAAVSPGQNPLEPLRAAGPPGQVQGSEVETLGPVLSLPWWVRPGLQVPAPLAARPRCPRRGLPITFTTALDADGAADFTALDPARVAQAAQEGWCGLCGTPHSYWKAFLGSPAAVERRAYTDPPMHPACAHAALELCPHLLLRQAVRRRTNPGTVTPPGFSDTKPETWVLYLTRSYRTVWHRGVLIFRPAPAHHTRTYHYADNGRLHLDHKPEPGGDTTPSTPRTGSRT